MRVHLIHRYRAIGVKHLDYVPYVGPARDRRLDRRARKPITVIIEQCVKCPRTRDDWTITGTWSLEELNLT